MNCFLATDIKIKSFVNIFVTKLLRGGRYISKKYNWNGSLKEEKYGPT